MFIWLIFVTTQQFSVNQRLHKSLRGFVIHKIVPSCVKVLRHFETLISTVIIGVLTVEPETKIDSEMSSEIFLGEITSTMKQLCGIFRFARF